MLSGAYPNGTYYIYSFDGRLLAEYDVSGFWIRDYIYFGGRLVAEYRAATPQPQYYFYASDQINSTRIVTDSTGTVVYSAAHEPYGGIQQTWVGTYDPELKFSGKPRDAESELDYFGARYYDRALYRFISTDPLYAANTLLHNPQLLNPYIYSKNNPISFIDFNGNFPINITITRSSIDANGGIRGTFSLTSPYGSMEGYTLERPYYGDVPAQTRDSTSSIMAGDYTARYVFDAQFSSGTADAILLSGNLLGARTGIYIHNGIDIDIATTTGCILVGANPTMSPGRRQEIFDHIIGAEQASLAMSVMMVMQGFMDLISMSDFAEITVTIVWASPFLKDQAELIAWQNRMGLFSIPRGVPLVPVPQ